MALFSNIKQAYRLFQQIDLSALSNVSAKVDLAKVMHTVSNMDDRQLNGLMKMLSHSEKKKELPPIEGDFYHLAQMLSEEDRATQLKVRAFMEREIKPIANPYWLKAEFPFEVIPKLAALNICGVTYKGYGCPGRSS